MRYIGADIEDQVASRWDIHRPGDDRSYIIDVRECALLRSIAKNRHGLTAKKLIHEDSNNVAIAIANVLTLTINIVWSEHHEIEAEHFVADTQFLLHRQFGNSV